MAKDRDTQNIDDVDNIEGKKSFRDKIANIIADIRHIPNIALKNIIKFPNLAPKLQKIKARFSDKRVLFGSIAVFVVLCAIIIIVFIISGKEEPLSVIYKPKPINQSRQVSSSTNIAPMSAQELESMIQKASLLYSNGQTSEALDIYNNISVFSQSIANFNLGVAKLNEQNYADSIVAFNGTIESGENIAASAINAAVAAYKLGDMRRYDYYVSLAKGMMIDWYDKPLYSYLYSLTNYYSGNYFNTLSSLKNPNSSFYKQENASLLAKTYLAFNDNFNALKALLNSPDSSNEYAVGLLYARMGEYDMAYEALDLYLRNQGLNDKKALMAKALVEIKRSNFASVSSIYESLLKQHDALELSEIYPIKIKLQDSLFDIDLVQKNFWDRTSEQNKIMDYKILFYFAPFKVFNVNDTLNLINEGGLTLKMNNIEEATNILAQGVMLSRINTNITQGLKEMLSYNINNALQIMKQASLAYPNHQVLQYNLGLIYAQLNDFQNARKHFLKAFHLDNRDILSGIFALMCAHLTYSDSQRIANEIIASIENARFSDSTQEGFLRSLFGFVNGNISDDLLWFSSPNISQDSTNPTKTPIMYALNALYSINSRDRGVISNAFMELQTASNNDMVAQILYRIASHYNQNIKEFSLNLFDFFKNDLKNLDLVYTGPSFARQIYIYMAFLVGANSYVDTILTNKLLNTQGDISGILQALALNSIYLLEFEKSFVYYNTLIDDYKLQTSENYFLASVAAIGAGHYDNAVALLQLSRMESKTNLEARYALGLLYLTNKNIRLSSLQFAQIGDVKFKSDFFDFEIDTSKILERDIK